MSNKIIQLMPLPDPGYEFQQARPDGSGNDYLQIVGAALTDTGQLLTLCYDKRFSFSVMDPERKQAVYNLKRAIEKSIKQ